MRRTADERRSAFQRGAEAEAHVAGVYEREGWEIVGRNLRVGGAELDIVVRRGGELRFVEVKARECGDLSGIESITVDKQRRLCRGAAAFLQAYDEDLVEEATFDVVVVSYVSWGMRLERWEHAFDARA